MLQGQAPDRGLYFLDKFPRLPPDEIAGFSRPALSRNRFPRPVPLHRRRRRTGRRWRRCAANPTTSMCRWKKSTTASISCGWTTGPTASFKDFAAQMMARLIGRFLREDGRAGHDSDRDQRRHRLGRRPRVSQHPRHPRHRPVSLCRGQRQPAQADDHLARQHPHRGD